jgi:predicted metal-dependent hydrolase
MTTTTTELPEHLRVADLEFEVRGSPRRSTFGITIERDGSLILRAPLLADVDELAEWAVGKAEWVCRKLAEKDLLLVPGVVKQLVSGEGFDLLGRHYRLKLTDGSAPVGLRDGRLWLPRTLADAGDGTAALIDWYQGQARAWLPSRIQPWVSRMAARPQQLDVRDLGYRWGSLGKGDRLNLHWAVMQLPPSLIDYVIVHELAHINEPHHTPAFWRKVRRVLPDYEQRRSRLAVAGSRLWLR